MIFAFRNAESFIQVTTMLIVTLFWLGNSKVCFAKIALMRNIICENKNATNIKLEFGKRQRIVQGAVVFHTPSSQIIKVLLAVPPQANHAAISWTIFVSLGILEKNPKCRNTLSFSF